MLSFNALSRTSSSGPDAVDSKMHNDTHTDNQRAGR
jgi:hypothetical protein